MIDQNRDLTELKRRAKAGELQALQELRNLGYFEKKKAEKEGYPVTHTQKRLWILNQMERESAVYNVPGALLLQGPLQLHALRRALEAVVQRHEALRILLDIIHVLLYLLRVGCDVLLIGFDALLLRRELRFCDARVVVHATQAFGRFLRPAPR